MNALMAERECRAEETRREANRNEGLHSVLMGKLNRLARRTKGYRKSVEMLIGSLAMLWLRLDWI